MQREIGENEAGERGREYERKKERRWGGEGEGAPTDVTRLGEGSLNGTIYKNGRGTKGTRHDGDVPVNEPLCIVCQGSDDRNADKGTDKGRDEDLDSCWGLGRVLEFLGIVALALHLAEVRLDR